MSHLRLCAGSSKEDFPMNVFAHRVHVLALAFLAWIGLVSIAWAASDTPPWRQSLSCDPTAQRHSGLEYCTSEAGKVHVVVVDLHSPGVRLEYVIAEGLDGSGQFGECQDVNTRLSGRVRGGCIDPDYPAYYPVMTLEGAAELAEDDDTNTAVVIDSDYGAGTQGQPGEYREHGPEGYTVVRGVRLDGPANGDVDNNAVNRPWLAAGSIAPMRVELNQFAGVDGGKADWIYTAVGGWPWLIRGGAVQERDIAECRDAPGSPCYDGAVQTAVGLSQDHRWLFLVIDARGGKLLDMAQFMSVQLAAWDAIKFDGGGSSQLWYSGQYMVSGDGRELSQYLAVVAPPGSGIVVTSPSPSVSPTEKLTALFEQLRQTVTRQLRAWRQLAEQEARRRVEEWMQQLEERLQHEAERQAEELTSQLCGSSMLAPVGLVLVLTVRRRRRTHTR